MNRVYYLETGNRAIKMLFEYIFIPGKVYGPGDSDSSVVFREGQGAVCLLKVIDGLFSLAHGVQMTHKLWSFAYISFLGPYEI